VLPGATIGSECNICNGVFIENHVTVGDRVTIKCGVQLWDGVTLENDVFIGPNATFTNDIFPRSKDYSAKIPQTLVCAGASIGANSTILPGVVIGKKAMVGAGAVVTKSVPANAIAVGNPARIVGYIEGQAKRRSPLHVATDAVGVTRLQARGVELHRFKLIKDMRGDLTVGDFGAAIPFIPKRYFLVLNVPSSEIRGEHAHRCCHQFLVATHGSVSVVVDDGVTREEVRLASPDLGLFLPAMTWGVQYKYSVDAVLLVFASESYDPSDYIRDYDEFTALASSRESVR